mmetsp:Transcript_720/g.1320  ORF Transcript_720/g.1320 Transcript_720/m.1320 type:complete len:244 (+) Transcript_720:425-1156(+)
MMLMNVATARRSIGSTRPAKARAARARVATTAALAPTAWLRPASAQARALCGSGRGLCTRFLQRRRQTVKTGTRRSVRERVGTARTALESRRNARGVARRARATATARRLLRRLLCCPRMVLKAASFFYDGTGSLLLFSSSFAILHYCTHRPLHSSMLNVASRDSVTTRHGYAREICLHVTASLQLPLSMLMRHIVSDCCDDADLHQSVIPAPAWLNLDRIVTSEISGLACYDRSAYLSNNNC